MKKIIFKSLFSFMFVFGIFILANTCFCAAQQGEKIYFEKPDSWSGENVFVDFIDSSDNSHLVATPGSEMTKSLVKFELADVFSIKGDIYSFEIPDVAGKNYDTISFSDGSANSTLETTYVKNTLYRITEGTGTNQTAKTYEPTLIDITKMIKYIDLVENSNPELYNSNLELFNKLKASIKIMQEILLDESGTIDIFPEIIEPLSQINDMTQKEDGILDDLNQKIEEAKNAIENGGYTEESTNKLIEDIATAENIRDNQELFTNDQVKNMIDTLTDDINNLVVDTTELERLLEEAKKIYTEKYTDETVKTLNDAITNSEAALKDKTNLTVDKLKELITELKDAMNSLKEKDIVNEEVNPATGDSLYIALISLTITTITVIFTSVYSKKKTTNN